MKILNWWRSKPSEQTKQTIFVAIPLVMFTLISANLFLTEEADYFARLGSLIVAWAILNIAVPRGHYSNHLGKMEQERHINNHNRQSKMRDLMGESLTLTFDLHASQIVQIQQSLGQENIFVKNTPEAIEKFCLDVEKRFHEAQTDTVSKDIIFNAGKAEDEYLSNYRRITIQEKALAKLEISLLVWGTIQWGYGDLLVKWWASL